MKHLTTRFVRSGPAWSRAATWSGRASRSPASGSLGVPEWVLPALAQSETVLPFLDFPERVITNPAPDRRIIDIRTINGPFTPKDQFFTTQHYGHPKVDVATYTLRVSGLVDRPLSLSLDDLRKLGSRELVAGFECSGNRGPVQGLSSNARWTGVPLKTVLDKAGVKTRSTRVRVLRRRPRRGRRRVAQR
jgi:hypothetical protein